MYYTRGYSNFFYVCRQWYTHTHAALITEISGHLKNICHILITALITFKHYTIVKRSRVIRF